MTRVLVTGAGGFVGRPTVRALAARGAQVHVLARSPERAPPEAQGVHLTEDVFSETEASLRPALKGVDTVLHLAWHVDPSDYLVSSKNLDCMAGTLRFAQAVQKAGVRRFVSVGTCLEYDTAYGYLTPETPLRPNSPYAAAKAGVFQALSQVLPGVDVSFAWARLFHLFGEGDDPRRLVAYLHTALAAGEPVALTSGRQIRDYLDVAEAGAMLAEFALSDHQGAANICSGAPVTVAALAQQIADRYGRRDLLRLGAQPDRPGDPACIVGAPWRPVAQSSSGAAP